jgi:hypothetical protein
VIFGGSPLSTGPSPAPGFRIHGYTIVTYSNRFCKVGLRKERIHGWDEDELLETASPNKLGKPKTSSEKAFMRHSIGFIGWTGHHQARSPTLKRAGLLRMLN